MSSGVFTERILIALLLGIAIGIERQWRQRMAGLRTNALVAVVAALFASISILMDARIARRLRPRSSGSGALFRQQFHERVDDHANCKQNVDAQHPEQRDDGGAQPAARQGRLKRRLALIRIQRLESFAGPILAHRASSCGKTVTTP